MAQIKTGMVTSDKGDKTITVNVVARKTHPLYRKQYSQGQKFRAHDEQNEATVGDLVEITETRPYSRRKTYKLSRIIEKAGARFEETDATADIPEEPKVETAEPKAKPSKPEAKPAEEEAK